MDIIKQGKNDTEKEKPEVTEQINVNQLISLVPEEEPAPVIKLEITEENVSEYSANYDFKYVKIKDAEFTPATDEQLATVKLELTGETVPVVDILGTEATATEEGTAVIEGYMFDLAGIKLFQPTSMELTSTGIANTADMLTGSEGATYNLNGQRVDKSYRGVVIRNGRKYIKK